MSWWLLLALGALTYASRAAALVLLPSLPEPVRAVLDRVPAALFAGLAVQSLVAPGGAVAEPPVLLAAAAAVVAAPMRSLLVCIAAGLGAYAGASLVL